MCMVCEPRCKQLLCVCANDMGYVAHFVHFVGGEDPRETADEAGARSDQRDSLGELDDEGTFRN